MPMFKSLLRLSLGLGLILAASAVLFLTDQPRPRPRTDSGQVSASSRRWRIGLVTYSESTVVEEAYAGVRAGLKEAGLVDGRDFTIDYRSAQGDIATLNSIYDELNGDDSDLVVSFSTPALQSGLRKVNRKPLIFGLVLDPIAAGAGKSDVDHRPGVTGVYLTFPYAEVVRTIRTVLPQARRVGSLFTPGEVNSVVARQRFEAALAKEGLALVSLPVNAPTEVSDAALNLCQSQIDVFCQIADSQTTASFPAIARACDTTKTPLFSFVSGLVSSGAILAVGSDFAENGREAGVLLAEVIRGKDPSAIPFRVASRARRAVNLDTARRYGVAIPADWLKQADLVLPAQAK
jgi:ABC-type uncharacterized transport system substrate-binding protein